MGLLSWFRRKKPSKPVGLSFGSSADLGLFHLAYERKRMPSPGIPAYAYETLGLVPFTQIGPSIATREPLRFATPTLLYQKAVPLAGVPTVSGSLVKVPLVNPDSAGMGQSVSGIINDPFPKELTQAAGYAL